MKSSKQMASKAKSLEAQAPPEQFDGFGFYKNTQQNTTDEGKILFYFFSDVVDEYGPFERDASIPEDREAYHVMLTSVRRGIVQIDAPFVSCFIDPFVYATRIAHTGFTGIMLKVTKYSRDLMKEILIETMAMHAKATGFVYYDYPNALVITKGTKQ